MKKVLGIVTVVLLVFSMISASGKKQVVIKRDTGKGKVARAVWNKLAGPLKDAVKVYKKEAGLSLKTIDTNAGTYPL